MALHAWFIIFLNWREGMEIKYNIRYSSRRTLGISILRDGSVVVRAPYRTPLESIEKIVREKANWIIKHKVNIRSRLEKNPALQFTHGEKHLYRGRQMELRLVKSDRLSCSFQDETIEIGLPLEPGPMTVIATLYRGYTREAARIFPDMLSAIQKKYGTQGFRYTKLIIKTMRSRWGSCSNRGVITLNTELIRLPDHLIEYVMIHELCHLKHHNHGSGFYNLLSELLPAWKPLRNELKQYTLGV
jgi:predicted metal-dependent hydrolase